MCKPEIWGGIECTINRVGDVWIDQLEKSGHYTRENDLDAIAGLGIKTLRYPALWETHELSPGNFDFKRTDKQLQKLHNLGIKPILGLLHHGSGPAFTNLLDDRFPEKFAAYAETVAQRYPWISLYTPINEPLTTARFSGLYGLWYPHKTNDVSCIKMLLNQLKGTILAMQAIRKVNPLAKLVQTEDMGKTFSTPLLSYQAKFENNRRWLTFDLLCGKVTAEHPLFKYFIRLGITAGTLQFFTENALPPDVIGINYYITSERYLDENINAYPTDTNGGNTLHEYADVEAIRVDHPYQSGFAEIMEEVWDRYRLPIAVTEVHLHCSREEQLKWFKEIYDQSKKLLDKNLKIIGVTTWSLLGAFGWSKLLTQPDGEYERGAFDVSSGSLRPTAMAGMIRQLIEKGEFHSPYILQPGWWHLPNRFYKKQKRQALSATTSEQPILIIGNTGTLGKSFAKVCGERSLHYVLAGREEADITRPAAIESAIKKHKPWAIINAAGFVRVDEAERNIETCFLENTVGPGLLAEACYRHHLKLVSFSSDLVFDGEKDGPYVESDITNPLNNYGISKQQAEEKVLAVLPSALMIRTSAFFSPWDKYNFIYDVLLNLNKGHNFEAAADNFVSPTYVPHLVNTTLDLVIDNERGIWHLTNHEKVSWYQFARRAAILFDKDPALIRPVYNLQRPAAMPQQSVLHSEKGNLMPTLSEALLDYFTELTVAI